MCSRDARRESIMRQTVGILGTPVDLLDMDAVLARLEQFIRERRFHQVATANTDFLINALEDPELCYILRNADLIIPDGMPLIWASRLIRAPLPERVTGADLVPRVAALAAVKGYRIFMLGARPEVARQARARLLADYPGLQIVGCVSPPVAPIMDMDHEGLLTEIRNARPDVLLVAFGNPKQEKWIHMNRQGLADVPVCIGVGGTFDFVAGNIPRAPRWMQKSGLEWIHRLLQDPQRLSGRYSRDLGQFSRHLYRQWVVMRRQTFIGSGDVQAATVGDFTVLSIVGDLDGRTVPRVQALAEIAFEAHTDLILDLQRVAGIDGEGLGMLINMPKCAAACRLEMRLACVPVFVARMLEGSQLRDGPYRIAPTLAQAFTMPRREGLSWSIRCGSDTALIEVRGAAATDTVLRLELLCASLLKAGRRVDIDLRDVVHIDLNFLAMLCRIVSGNPAIPGVRIVTDTAVRALLKREKLEERFTLLAAPEPPLDYVEQPPDLIDLREIYITESSSARTNT
jgi:N-acetylglucosaminyldiphosphoundecaprenol N-acetyl-beta-D-mannosaminyltransferase